MVKSQNAWTIVGAPVVGALRFGEQKTPYLMMLVLLIR